MTAQRIITRDTTKEIYTAIRDALTSLEHPVPLQRLVWTCEICGMIHAGTTPGTCDSCGSSEALVLQQDTRPETNSRW